MKFSGLTDSLIIKGLFWITLYLLIHFIWTAWDNLIEWRLRLTGTRVAFVTTGRFASEHGDYPDDPRQSTLYNWWLKMGEKIGNLPGKTRGIEQSLEYWEERMKDVFKDAPDALNVANASRPINETRKAVSDLSQKIKAIQTIIVPAHRIKVSLKRFDRWFQLFLRSQNLRWLMLEFGFPVLLSGYALLLLAQRWSQTKSTIIILAAIFNVS